MTPSSFDFTVRTDELQAALKSKLAELGNDNFLPPFFKVGSRYLSLAETFQVLTDALAEMSRTGKLPETVRVDRIYGPLGLAQGHGPNIGDVKVASIAKICADMDARLHDDTGYPMPKNTIPPIFTVDGIRMNAAQFLRLMAQAMVDPSPEATLHVRMVYMLTNTAQIFPKARNMADVGATWTFKPAPLTQAQQTRNTGGSMSQADTRREVF
jgi:hypothetical protein